MTVQSVSFGSLPKIDYNVKIDYSKKDGGIPEDVPDTAVVAHGREENTYIYPITAGQVREQARQASKLSPKYTAVDIHKENPGEYYTRKLYSSEWTM